MLSQCSLNHTYTTITLFVFSTIIISCHLITEACSSLKFYITAAMKHVRNKNGNAPENQKITRIRQNSVIELWYTLKATDSISCGASVTERKHTRPQITNAPKSIGSCLMAVSPDSTFSYILEIHGLSHTPDKGR